jgi:flavin reductase (DIM6/NTAB) family NADH-FMN oxidoreductase RutF
LAAALGRIPSGLFVIAWRDGCGDRTMLASWVMQAAFTPPMISVAIASSRDLLAAVSSGTDFVLNILAGLAVERVAGIAALVDAVGWLHCRGVARAESGDHAVVIARILAGASASTGQPLVHLRRHGLRY